MRRIIFLGVVLMALTQFEIQAQQVRAITTGVPFLRIAADARAAGLGDQGVATTADEFSQQWNPAKFAFITSKQGVGVNYTPYLNKIANDIFLGSLSYHNRLNERSAFAASLRYFSLGEIDFAQDELQAQNPNVQNPNELTIDVSYSLKLSETFSMAVAGRYLRSDLRLQQAGTGDASAAGSFGVDIAGFYQSEEIAYEKFNGRWRAGFNISNIGPKIRYDDAGEESFIPTNFQAGVGFDFILDQYNRITPSIEFSKLLVPTPLDPDANGDGTVTTEERFAAIEEYNDISAFGAIFSSWGDAPDGFSEEIKEITWSLGAEYSYKEAFQLRAGYFNESEEKGSRKFATLGLGFAFNAVAIDASYLFSTASSGQSPLEGTLRFGLTFNFGGNYGK